MKWSLIFLEQSITLYILSLSTLKRRLRNAGLTRRTDYTLIGTVNAAKTHELTGSGQLLGYRTLWQTLRQKYFLTVKRDDVMNAIRRLDPSGVQLRHRRRFVRKGYFTAGPKQVWHVDGYDKLKPFGIAISGCIDGFSRKVMWLRIGSSNNDPGIFVYHYLQCVSELVVPARLRTDCGTESGTMVAIHCALRAQHTDDFAGALSHMYGTSTANQRIKSWSFFRKQRYRPFKINSKTKYYKMYYLLSFFVCVCCHITEGFSCQQYVLYENNTRLKCNANLFFLVL